ncbi:beta-ketoacyl-[acyl-carrier-protein] synthase family protein [uncultured Desulfobacter sp.]|uniref:beta-ketoacyl-[acyl-carrier-protein] synthase family protein n=1 Tax=uncultured Desulfobacter sp. TaxID=240139 RepID=UPI002AAAEF33|nr:beta-ketoacyl-[acyl-carrier-protein] synthase family protein [uncultured Desulfobacter sp.]
MTPIHKPIAVTGMGAVCALGKNLAQCMDAMFNAPVDPAPPSAFTTDHPVHYPVFNLPENLHLTLEQQDRDLSLTARMAISAARQALEDAGMSARDLKDKRVGVCMGTTVGSSLNNDPFYAQYRAGQQPDMAPVKRFLISNPAQAVADTFGFTGPVQTVVNACASGSDAIGIAREWINSGLCDLAIAGGSDELCKVTYNGFISLMITDPCPCRPFDAQRSGLNLGEGAAAMLLAPARDGSLKGNRIQGYVSGYGAAGDAYHLTKPRPDAAGLMSALDQVLTAKTTHLQDIGFINAHGTGTRDNDRMEMTVFKEKLPGIPFFSTKGYTGHTLGAAGALEAVFTLACLNRREIPPSRGFSTPDPDFNLSPVTAVLDIDKPAAISQSVAFGGTNAVLLFHRADTDRQLLQC